MERATEYYANVGPEWQQAVDEVTKPCIGGHKVDGQTPKLQDIQFDNRTCDCGRMRFVVESCGCGENAEKELHGYPNQT